MGRWILRLALAARRLAGALACLLACFAGALGASAQPVVAIVQYNAPPDTGGARAYVAGLKQLGLAEGSGVRIERRYANGDPRRIPAVIAEVAALRPAVVFTLGHDIAKVARERHPELAIVTAGSEDPVMSGLVKSIARPGSNVTGVTYMSPQVAGKRLELLKLAVPGLTRVAVVWDPSHFDNYYREMDRAAQALGLRLVSLEVHEREDLERVPAAAAAAGAQAVFVVPSRLTQFNAARIAALCRNASLPAMAAYATFVEAGGLLAYGADLEQLMHSAAAQTRKILNGIRPAEIPIEQAQRFLFVVNGRTAGVIGLKLPAELLVRADRVID